MAQSLQVHDAEIAVSSVTEHKLSGSMTRRAAQHVVLDTEAFKKFYFEMDAYAGTSVAYSFLCNKAFRFETFIGTAFPASYSSGEDQAWLILDVLPRVHRGVIVPDAVYHYRLRKSSLFSTEKRRPDFLSVYLRYLKAEKNMSKAERKLLSDRLIGELRMSVAACLKSGDRRERQRLRSQAFSMAFDRDLPLTTRARKQCLKCFLPDWYWKKQLGRGNGGRLPETHGRNTGDFFP